jgi:hypothetical protein
MLNLIAHHIGGKVNTIDKINFVIWVVNDRKHIRKIIKIFSSYPPLTSRLKYQLAFMLECFERENVKWYLNSRDKKYLITNTEVVNIDYLYFNEWLSGFIEAEGCFSFRFNSNHSFSIGQNDDKYLIDTIKTHFEIKSQVRNTKKRFWLIETYRKSTLVNIINHCIKYPLLGAKVLSFSKFKDLYL